MIKNLKAKFLRTAARTGRKFARAKRGNVAVIFALAMIPVVGGVGGAVDFSRAYVAKARLLDAIDSAALAVGTSQLTELGDMQVMAQKFFDANYDVSLLGGGATITLSVSDGVITVNADTHIETLLLGVVGMETIEVSAHTEVVKESKAIEVAMVLDNTGSMGSGGKIDALKLASQSLVDILFGSNETHPKLKIGLVPFSQSVNVGPDKKMSGWMDANALSSIHGENFETSGSAFFMQPNPPKYAVLNSWAGVLGQDPVAKINHKKKKKKKKKKNKNKNGGNSSAGPVNIFDLYDDINNVSWAGCVESRPEPYDTTDDAPSTGTPDTLFVPYFAPDEPDIGGGYQNNYLSDGISGGVGERQANSGKYKNANVSGPGPNRGCSIPPLTPLVNSKSVLTSAIGEMVASGYTHIPLGLVWGWRLLSPSEPFTEGVSYGDEDTTKALILLTDGYNTIQRQNSHNNSAYSAFGYVANKRFGTPSYSSAVARLDPKTAEVCNRVKDSGIRVYTITFQLHNGSIKDLMRDCATEPGLYFDSPNNEELKTVFSAIARDLSNLRISK